MGDECGCNNAILSFSPLLQQTFDAPRDGDLLGAWTHHMFCGIRCGHYELWVLEHIQGLA